jgi:hypothetical protein
MISRVEKIPKNPKKSQKRREQVETRLTGSKRKASGGSLVNPQKFYPCLICGEKKHMDYSSSVKEPL